MISIRAPPTGTAEEVLLLCCIVALPPAFRTLEGSAAPPGEREGGGINRKSRDRDQILTFRLPSLYSNNVYIDLSNSVVSIRLCRWVCNVFVYNAPDPVTSTPQWPWAGGPRHYPRAIRAEISNGVSLLSAEAASACTTADGYRPLTNNVIAMLICKKINVQLKS